MTEQDHLTVQLSVLMFVVEAIIANHPNKDAVRRDFDQMFGQFQASAIAKGIVRPDHTALMRTLVEKLFSP